MMQYKILARYRNIFIIIQIHQEAEAIFEFNRAKGS